METTTVKPGDFVHSTDDRDDPELFYDVIEVRGRNRESMLRVLIGLPGADQPEGWRLASDLTDANDEVRRLVAAAQSKS